MALSRPSAGSRFSATRPGARVAVVHEERRRSVRASDLGRGTLACRRCDAPVAIGPEVLSPTAPLCCPFCAHRGPLRDFLSLTTPGRPARVRVRVLV